MLETPQLNQRTHIREPNEARTLQEEVELVHSRDATVDHRAGLRVTVVGGVLRLGGEEARVVALAANHDGELGHVWSLGGVELPERLLDQRHLIVDDD